MLRLFKRKEIDPKLELRRILGDYELRSFPAAVLHVLKLLRDPETDLMTVGEKIAGEAGLVVRILRLVNSAAFGLSRPVDSIPHAVALLGRGRLESLVLSVAVRDALPPATTPAYDASRFWRAAARRATVARALAAILHPATQAETFTAALLQDMAIPVLASVMPNRYGLVLTDWHENEDSRLEDLEVATFGWDHPEIGGLMAATWELPQTLTEAIGCHHDGSAESSVEPALRLAAQVRETEERPGLDRLVATAQTEFGLSPDHVVTTVKSAFDRANDLARMLG